MRTLRGTVLVAMAAWSAKGCGGGADGDAHDAAIDAVTARYDSPDDFDRAGCVPGSFADAVITGRGRRRRARR